MTLIQSKNNISFMTYCDQKANCLILLHQQLLLLHWFLENMTTVAPSKEQTVSLLAWLLSKPQYAGTQLLI